MPRYVRYKRYYKKVYPKKRWASNIKVDAKSITINPNASSGIASFILCQNSTPSTTPTPTILRFARFRMKGDIRTVTPNASNVTSANAFVMFVPEGMVINSELLTKHPEYILGWTTLSMDSGNSFSLTSTLKRNLNSGDSIQILFTIDTVTAPQSTIGFNVYYTCQFWTSSS